MGGITEMTRTCRCGTVLTVNPLGGRTKYCSKRCAKHECKEQFLKRNGMSLAAFHYRRKQPAEKIGNRFQMKAGVTVVAMGETRYYRASIMFKGEHRSQNFSISKLGDTGARLAAALQRMCWMIELGAWRPDSGDPMAILGYTELFKGNNEYDHARVWDQESPELLYRNDED